MWVALYVAAIVAVNWMFTAIAPWSTPLGDLYLANVVVGFIFVLRDYAQREIGHYILFATAVAGVLTWFMVDPAIAVASITAFILSETADWGVYSFLRRPLSAAHPDLRLIRRAARHAGLPVSRRLPDARRLHDRDGEQGAGRAAVWYLLRLRYGKADLAAAS